MSVRAFSEPAVRDRISSTVAGLERRTAAELVVAVRPSAGHYRHADYAFGAVVALAVTVVFVFHPHPFRSELFPLELALAFVLGALFCGQLPPLRRLLVSRALKRENLQRAARAAFVELGVGSTRQRTGMLIFVSMFERDAEIVLDVGIDPGVLGPEWTDAALRIRLAAKKAEPNALIAALEDLGAMLERCLPCSVQDVDELGNEIRFA